MTIDTNLQILIVDDYKMMLRIIRHQLKQVGLTCVEVASDGAGALEKLRERAFGLIISDWNMQPMTGLDLLHEVRADPALAHLPFIMITAESKAEKVVTAKEAGVDAYIVKPFNAETLKAKIMSAVGKA